MKPNDEMNLWKFCKSIATGTLLMTVGIVVIRLLIVYIYWLWQLIPFVE